MKTSVNTSYLRIPMSMLYDIGDIEKFSGLDKENVEQLPKEYSNEELAGIFAALSFAKKNPDFDFKGLLPDISYSNHQIYDFLKKIHASIATHSDFVRD